MSAKQRIIQTGRRMCGQAGQAVAESPGWKWSFLGGLVLPLALYAMGNLAPAFYNSIWLPLVFRWMDLWSPAVLATAAFLLLFRSESSAWRTAVGIALLGLHLGIFVFFDLWYAKPLWGGAALTLLVWRLRILLWSRCQATAFWLCAVGMLLALGMLFDWQAGLPWRDNRMGFGLPLAVDLLLLALLFGGLGLLVWRWAGRHWRHGDAGNRALLAEIIEREPRCQDYFAHVRLATKTRFISPSAAELLSKPDMERLHRLPCATAEQVGRPHCPPIFPPLGKLPSHLPELWQAGRLAIRQPLVRQVARLWRCSVADFRLSSPLFMELLAEAASRELNAFAAALLAQTAKAATFRARAETGTADKEAIPRTAESHPFDDWANTADTVHLARFIALQEARIEAHCYFFLPLVGTPPATPTLEQISRLTTNLAANLDLSTPSLLPAGDSHPAKSQPATRQMASGWQDAYCQYQRLWLLYLDWLVMKTGGKLATGLANGGLDNLASLTHNLLFARTSWRRFEDQPESVGEAALTLAFAVFLLLLEDGRTGTVEQQAGLKKAYAALRLFFTWQRSPATVGKAKGMVALGTAEEWEMAGAAYGLCQLLEGNIDEAARPVVLFEAASASRRSRDAASESGNRSPYAATGVLRQLGLHLKGIQAWQAISEEYLEEGDDPEPSASDGWDSDPSFGRKVVVWNALNGYLALGDNWQFGLPGLPNYGDFLGRCFVNLADHLLRQATPQPNAHHAVAQS